jgi:hypothetical protein
MLVYQRVTIKYYKAALEDPKCVQKVTHLVTSKVMELYRNLGVSTEMEVS